MSAVRIFDVGKPANAFGVRAPRLLVLHAPATAGTADAGGASGCLQLCGTDGACPASPSARALSTRHAHDQPTARRLPLRAQAP